MKSSLPVKIRIKSPGAKIENMENKSPIAAEIFTPIPKMFSIDAMSFFPQY